MPVMAAGQPQNRAAMAAKAKESRAFKPVLDPELERALRNRLASAVGLSTLEEDVARWVEDYKAKNVLPEDSQGILSSGLDAISSIGGSALSGLKSFGRGVGNLAKGDISGLRNGMSNITKMVGNSVRRHAKIMHYKLA